MAILNVKTGFSAAGNGTTNDTTAIANAVAAAASGDVLYFPTGSYRTTGALSLANVTLLGDGPTLSTLLFEPPTDYAAFSTNGSNVVMRNIGFKRNAAHFMVAFPIGGAASNFLADHCLFDGNNTLQSTTENHLFELGNGNFTNFVLRNSTFQNFGGYCVFQNSSSTSTTTGVTTYNCTFTNNHLTDLELNSPNGTLQTINIQYCTFDTNFGPPAGGFGVGLANCATATVAHNTFNNYLQEGVHIEDRSSNMDIMWNTFTNCGQTEFASIEVVDTSTGIRIQHNNIDGSGTKGPNYIAAIAVLTGGGAGPPTSITINDNTINCGSNAGIFHQATTIAITNNRFEPGSSISDAGSTGVTSSGNTVSAATPSGFTAGGASLALQGAFALAGS